MRMSAVYWIARHHAANAMEHHTAAQNRSSMTAPSPLLPPQASIEDYAAIGDCRTLALVSRFGSIDWWCISDFSGPSFFAALLDRERGGCFALMPRHVDHVEQRYDDHTNVLRTRFTC